MLPTEIIQSKIIAHEDLTRLLLRWQLKGQKIVFTNGVFDILHRGHVTLLAEAATLGDHLIIGLNSDTSVKMLGKGSDRPINAELDRAFVLAGLTSVAAIVIFDEPTPLNLIKKIKPDILIKGGDYDPDQKDKKAKDYIVGSDLQRESGGETISIDLVAGYSTTAIIKKSKNG